MKHSSLKPSQSPVYLSWGLGVESTAILVRWMLSWAVQDRNEEAIKLFARPLNELIGYVTDPGFQSHQLTVVTAQLGSEMDDTIAHSEAFILPLMRALEIRFCEISRADKKISDGVFVHQDTRYPNKLHPAGKYTLAAELAASGTLPSYAGDHLCSIKHKKEACEPFIAFDSQQQSVVHAFGYNTDERSRILKSEQAIAERNKNAKPTNYTVVFGYNVDEKARLVKAQTFDVGLRSGLYPLADWNWSRAQCQEFLWQALGTNWGKSACCFCVFSKPDEERIRRLRSYPHQTAQTLYLEYLSLCMNPRGTSYPKGSFREVCEEHSLNEGITLFEEQINNLEWAIYEVRRIYKAKGAADRCTKILQRGTRSEMEAAFATLPFHVSYAGLSIETHRGITYAYFQRRGLEYPSREGFYVCAPAVIEEKTRHGFQSFDLRWNEFDARLFAR